MGSGQATCIKESLTYREIASELKCTSTATVTTSSKISISKNQIKGYLKVLKEEIDHMTSKITIAIQRERKAF